MRYVNGLAVALSAALLAPGALTAQMHDEANHAVANPGIFAKGWTGRADSSARMPATVNDARFAMEGNAFHIVTGPATMYWNPANRATGDYVVTAHFREPQYMNLNDHPHPYGVFIAGNDMGGPDESLLYCEAYGNGNFIVRGFGPKAFQMNGRMGATSDAVHKAAGKNQEVTQDISMWVKGDRVGCTINGTEVASYPKSDVLGDGKLKTTDGVYGIRSAHNTEVFVTNFGMKK